MIRDQFAIDRLVAAKASLKAPDNRGDTPLDLIKRINRSMKEELDSDNSDDGRPDKDDSDDENSDEEKYESSKPLSITPKILTIKIPEKNQKKLTDFFQPTFVYHSQTKSNKRTRNENPTDSATKKAKPRDFRP